MGIREYLARRKARREKKKAGKIAVSLITSGTSIVSPSDIDVAMASGGGGGGSTRGGVSTLEGVPTIPIPTPTPTPERAPVSTVEQVPTRDVSRIRKREFEFGVSPERERVGVPVAEVPIGEILEEEPTKKIGAVEFFFGETGKKFIGIGGGIMPLITAQEIKTGVRTLGLPGKVVGELIPTTPGETAITGALVGLGLAGPSIVRPLISGGVGFLGARTALDPTAPTETRIAGGIVGGLGVAGFTAETLPYARSVVTRFSPKFEPVKIAPEGFEVIKLADKDIGLIQPGKGDPLVDLPKISPLKRGGFGVKAKDKPLFLSGEQILATSQRGLFEAGKDIPLQKEFFVTPQEPFLKIAETRVSRLGLADPLKPPKDIQIGWGLPGKPQIGYTRAGVGMKETATQFKIGTGTELEAIKTFGKITDIKLTGKTIIKGQAVDIFEFKIGDTPLGKPKDIFGKDILGKDILGKLPTTARGEFVSGTGLLSTALGTGLLSLPTTTRRGKSSLRVSFPTAPTEKPSFPTKPFGKPSKISYPKREPPILPTTPTYPTPRRDFFPTTPSPKKKKPFYFGFDDPFKDLTAKRKFKRTPSIGTVLRYELTGFKQERGARAGEISGLAEREIGLGKLPQIELPSLLGKVTKTKSNKKNKVKKNKK